MGRTGEFIRQAAPNSVVRLALLMPAFRVSQVAQSRPFSLRMPFNARLTYGRQ